MEFLKSFQLSESLSPKDSFFGGRTNGVRLHCVAAAREEIRYVDINSLYPHVNKTKTYPVGQPTILVNPEDQDNANYFRIAKVKILLPSNLYHPVLPVHIGRKLMFPLCEQCVKEELEKPWLNRTAVCTHTAEERCMTGSWCTPELQKAVDLGNKILKIHEVRHFPEDQRKEGLFADYVNKWLKSKTEASGWPKNCNTETAKSEYIKAYYDREGVQLEIMASTYQ